MPLSKKRMRERKRRDRVKPMSNLIIRSSVKPNTLDNLRQTIKNIEGKTKAPQHPSGEASVPLYNPSIHKPGDRVLVKPPYGNKLVEIVIPELDAGGQPVPNYD